MARIRSIKPEFWVSEQVLACKPVTRLLFIGMWNFCDDYGRMPFAPRTIKAQIFPDDPMSIDEIRDMVTELGGNGLLVIYTANGREYLEITGWHHQKIDKPHKPKHPAPFVEETKTVAEPSPNVPRTLAVGKDKIGEERKERSSAGVDFEKFWNTYPKRDGANPRKPAFEKFERLVRGGVDPQKIIVGATIYAGECERLKIIGTEKVCQAIVFLNQERFNDYASRGKSPEQEAVINLDMAKRGYEWRDGKWVKLEEQVQ